MTEFMGLLALAACGVAAYLWFKLKESRAETAMYWAALADAEGKNSDGAQPQGGGGTKPVIR